MSFNLLMLVTDRWSGICWDFHRSDRKEKATITLLKHLFNLGASIWYRTNEVDNELNAQKPEIKAYINSQFMTLEPSAPYTRAQLGMLNAQGVGIVKERICGMTIGPNLPDCDLNSMLTAGFGQKSLVLLCIFTIEYPDVLTIILGTGLLTYPHRLIQIWIHSHDTSHNVSEHHLCIDDWPREYIYMKKVRQKELNFRT